VDRGLLALGEGDTGVAIEHFEAAVEELELADQDERPGAAEALERARLCLGETLAASGQLSRAEGELQEVVRLLQRRCNEAVAAPTDGPASGLHAARLRGLRSSLAHAFRALGHVLLMRGDISGALVHLHEAREDWLDLAGDQDADGAAFALALAGALRAAGRFSEVEEPLEAARILAGGDMDRPALGSLPIALHDLGVAAGDRGDHASAATLLDEAVMLASSLLGRKDPLLARINYTRGLLYLAEGELGRAEDKFESVLEWDLGSDDQAEALRALARAAMAWTRSREGAHRHHEAELILADAEDALAASRGVASTTAAHIRILRESLRG
jgi:tetratricopeptide (TPR) repeat protein